MPPPSWPCQRFSVRSARPHARTHAALCVPHLLTRSLAARTSRLYPVDGVVDGDFLQQLATVDVDTLAQLVPRWRALTEQIEALPRAQWGPLLWRRRWEADPYGADAGSAGAATSSARGHGDGVQEMLALLERVDPLSTMTTATTITPATTTTTTATDRPL
jgi:hypothetical protein